MNVAGFYVWDCQRLMHDALVRYLEIRREARTEKDAQWAEALKKISFVYLDAARSWRKMRMHWIAVQRAASA